MTTKANKQPFSVRVEPEVRKALDAAAERDRRSTANLVRCVLSDFVAGKLVPARTEMTNV